ncbi:MAG: (2Fe-2S)-binding protein [Candidatus Caldarchaeum sp.]|nr:(2Fe-2S)-binding protein [Candidatus Caldarchaeum sp.]MDW7977573.1 (2Fe-2S)-binding protein [Candidatus Caldarchaeum sp.]MDW8360079.1 (2Fe-2S)-binding protein [Candidatus Caldarchaeum sp.]
MGVILREFSFKLNGQPVSVKAPPAYTLLETLRYVIRLTGTKDGCSSGDCGACTVLLDGRAVHSCLTLISHVQGREVVTVEGVDPKIVKAYASEGAVQCGYCIPGLVVATAALLREHPKPSAEEVREMLKGNLCRCTGYVKIVKAVEAAAGV